MVCVCVCVCVCVVCGVCGVVYGVVVVCVWCCGVWCVESQRPTLAARSTHLTNLHPLPFVVFLYLVPCSLCCRSA